VTRAPELHSGINQGVAPVTYGQGERPPRGDYARARADYTCDQNWVAYTPAEHDLYRLWAPVRTCLESAGLKMLMV